MQVNDFFKYLESRDLRRIDGGSVAIDDASSDFLYIVINNLNDIAFEIDAKNSAAQIIIAADSNSNNVYINVADGAKLNLVEVLFDNSKSCVVVNQSRDSEANITVLEVGNTNCNFKVNLDGENAATNMSILQLISQKEQAKIEAIIAHNSAGCISRSLSKCIAGDCSVGEFKGLVYVAKDAQRTEAYQNSRNITLSDSAKIVAEPQLEIYADDVKCSHGATVGQMNSDAIFYMQQRGLNESQARKVQLEGFVIEVMGQCSIESLTEGLSAVAMMKLDLL